MHLLIHVFFLCHNLTLPAYPCSGSSLMHLLRHSFFHHVVSHHHAFWFNHLVQSILAIHVFWFIHFVCKYLSCHILTSTWQRKLLADIIFMLQLLFMAGTFCATLLQLKAIRPWKTASTLSIMHAHGFTKTLSHLPSIW